MTIIDKEAERRTVSCIRYLAERKLFKPEDGEKGYSFNRWSYSQRGLSFYQLQAAFGIIINHKELLDAGGIELPSGPAMTQVKYPIDVPWYSVRRRWR